MASIISCRSSSCDLKVIRLYSHTLCQNYPYGFLERGVMGNMNLPHSLYTQGKNCFVRSISSKRWVSSSTTNTNSSTTNTNSSTTTNLLHHSHSNSVVWKSTPRLTHLSIGCRHSFELNSPHTRNFHINRCGTSCILCPQCSSLCLVKWMSTGRKRTHYYDILGLTSKSTQKQIKTAYYEMSKKYHPDVAHDKKSHALFTEINEAYEVLGNIQKRRMYDRGMFNPRDQRSYDEGDYTQSYKSKETSSPFERGDRPPPPTGRSKIYNFDEFYKQHYTEMRERRNREYKQYLLHKQRMDDFNQQRKQSKLSTPLVMSLCLTVGFLMIMINDKWDNDVIRKESGR